jgi:hypothetical protein
LLLEGEGDNEKGEERKTGRASFEDENVYASELRD